MKKVLTIINDFSRMTDDNLLVKAEEIQVRVSDNPVFATPTPSAADLADSIDAYRGALINSLDGSRLNAAIKNQKREELIQLLYLLADFVLFKSEGDPVTAMSSGFTIGKAASPRPPITAPQNAQLLQGENSGELIGKINRVPGAISYLHQFATEAEMAQDKWTSIPSSRIKCRISNLQPGTRIYYRAGALGPKDQLVFSTITSRIVA